MATPVDAGSIYSDVRIRLDKLSGDVSSVKTQFDKLNTNTQAANTKTEKSFKSLGLVGVAQITAITLAFKSAVSTFATTEQSLANVKAVSNATAAEFALLEKAANSAGTTTRFTAGEAADALYNLASAGLDATQSVSALDGVLALAGATGSDLATASQAVTSSLSQFSLEASDAGKVSNVFAAAISNSQATLEKMKMSLTAVGPIAGALGISLEEVTGSLQALYNAGYKGETAGTALKTSLAFLADQSSTTVSKLEALGIAFEDINPEKVGLTGALRELEEAGLSTADVIAAFGTEAGPAMVSLLSKGVDAIEDYTDAITDTDEAARQYAVQNDTLAGSFDAFKSAAEGAGNSLVSQLAPIFRTMLDLAAGLLKVISKLPDVVKGLGAGAGVAAGGFIVLTKALSLLGIALGTGPLGIITLLGAAVVGLVSLNNKAKEMKQTRLADEFSELAETLGYAGSAIDDFVKKAGDVSYVLGETLNGDLEKSVKLVGFLSSELGISEEQVIQIGLQSKNLLETQKEQLRTTQAEITERQILSALALKEATAELALASGQTARLEIEKTLVERAREKAQLELEAAREEEERLERAKQLAVIREQIASYDDLYKKGAISEQEALEGKILLRKNELDLMVKQSVESGRASASIVDDIKNQRNEIEEYQLRLDELTNTEVEIDIDLSGDFEKKWAEALDSQSKTALDFLADEREQAIAEAEALGADTTDVVAYYEAEKNKIKEEMREEDAASAEAYWTAEQEMYMSRTSYMLSAASSFFSALSALSSATADTAIANIEAETAAKIAALDEDLLGTTEYEEQVAALEAQAASDEAKIEYDSSMYEWKLSKLSAVVSGAQAILQTFANFGFTPWGIAAAASQAVVSGVQFAAINAAEPVPAATGGIILPSAGGTLVNAAENGSSELLLNGGSSGSGVMGTFADQIAARIGGSGGGATYVTIEIPLDGTVIAKKTVKVMNTGAAGQISAKRAITS